MSTSSDIYLWPVPGNISPIDTLLRNGPGGASPTFSVDWTTTSSIPATITFSRASSATYYNSSGVVTTASSGAARIEYNPATLAQQGLLVEEQRTNLIIQSGSLSNAAWTVNHSAKATDATVAPDGTTAEKITADSATSDHSLFTTAAVPISAGSNYVVSTYAKAGTVSAVAINVQDNVTGTINFSAVFDISGTTDASATQTSTHNAATLISTSSQYVGNGWFRINIVGSFTAVTNVVIVLCLANATTGNTIAGTGEPTFVGNNTQSAYFALPQLELGGRVSSAIITAAAAVTRSADIVSTVDSGLLAAGAWLIETGEMAAATAATLLGINTIVGMGADATNHLTTADGGTQTTATTGTWTGLNRGGIAFDATPRVSISLDGGTVVTAANSPATPTALYFGNTNNGAGAFINGHIRMMAAYSALTDLQLPVVTVVGASFSIGGYSTYTLSLAAGAYVLTGSAAAVFATRNLAAVTGTFALTGSAATVFATRKLSAATGAYALTGAAASVFATRKLAATTGAYVLTGSTASTFATRKLSAATGAYTLTGSSATLIRKYVLSEASGSYALTGATASVFVTRKLAAVSGSYFLTGSSAPLKLTIKLPLTSGAYAITGSVAATFVTRKLSEVTGSYVLTGSTATTIVTRKLAAVSGIYALTGSTAQVFATRKLAAASGIYLLTGQDATLVKTVTGNYTLAADTGSYGITGSSATLVATYFTPTGGIYTVSGGQVVDHLPLQDGVEVVRAVSFPGSTTQRQTSD